MTTYSRVKLRTTTSARGKTMANDSLARRLRACLALTDEDFGTIRDPRFLNKTCARLESLRLSAPMGRREMFGRMRFRRLSSSRRLGLHRFCPATGENPPRTSQDQRTSLSQRFSGSHSGDTLHKTEEVGSRFRPSLELGYLIGEIPPTSGFLKPKSVGYIELGVF